MGKHLKEVEKNGVIFTVENVQDCHHYSCNGFWLLPVDNFHLWGFWHKKFLSLKFTLVFLLWRKQNQSSFTVCTGIWPDLPLPEHSGQDRRGRAKNTELAHDYYQIVWNCIALGPLPACFFALLPLKHSRSTSQYGSCPSVNSQIKWEKSYKTNYTLLFLWQRPFNARQSWSCAPFRWQVPFHMTWGKGEGKWHWQISLFCFSVSSSAILYLLAPDKEKKKKEKLRCRCFPTQISEVAT